MQAVTENIKNKVKELLDNGTVDRVLAWDHGEFFYDNTPAVITKDQIDNLVYDDFCGSNLSKILITESKKEGKVLVLLKPCDTYSLNELLLEHRVNRDNIYVLGIPCPGMLDINKIKDQEGIRGVKSAKIEGDTVVVDTFYGEKTCKVADVLLEKCKTCKGAEHKIADEVIESDMTPPEAEDRFAMVEKLENMTAEERFNFWRSELSKCIRCNACRNVCPACSCLKCVFDNDNSGVASKANTDEFEENMFHIIRAFHVAGRCTDCGECSRVCPQGIPLHLLNRKFIKDINELYGEYQAGASADSRPPLVNYTQDDVEPSIVKERGRE